VNAPHIPVHLGSLGLCVREVIKKVKVKKGDVVITNHPAYGGSHLPDVTLIKPVYYKNQLVGFVANRAHHAEIGGKKPGSMPADATCLEEEGVIIPPTFLVKEGKVKWRDVMEIFSKAKFPSRLPEENEADINGALASINLGEKELIDLCERESVGKVIESMQQLKTYSSNLLLQKIKQTKDRLFTAEERLDDGSKLKVKIALGSKECRIDFTGSSPMHPGNLNATPAIVQSVVLYALRLWVDKPIAMNEGLMECVKIISPQGLLNPDFSNQNRLPAVVGGNTEISQRLTDTLLKALQLAACSQGTMNNFLFGNSRFGYYETIGGGSGATFGHNGADAVHTHMTNTRITDPEILEYRYPVRLIQFSIRKYSGGKGKWKGGDGIVRHFIFEEDMSVNILAQHRKEKPYGLNGAFSGKPGSQTLVRKNGDIIPLGGLSQTEVTKGDKIIISTPGAGGFGKK
jgi:5-oxoprolinase (ATP-hydrolysing)